MRWASLKSKGAVVKSLGRYHDDNVFRPWSTSSTDFPSIIVYNYFVSMSSVTRLLQLLVSP